MSERQTSEIAGIDYLRLCAASFVMAFHFLSSNRLGSEPYYYADILSSDGSDTYFDFGWVGVELFFVISGYVIAFSAMDRTPWSFLRGRIIRLVPGAWFCATIELMILSVMHDPSRTNLFVQWIHTILFWPRGQIDSVYWTLQIEVCFYLIVLAMMQMGLKRLIEPLLVALGLCSGGFWLAVMMSDGPTHSLLADKGFGIVLRGLLVTHGSFFAVGVSLFAGFRDRFTVLRSASLFTMMGCCAIEIQAHVQWTTETSHCPASLWPPLILFFAGTGAVAASIHYNGGMVHRFGERGLRWTRIAGRMTYPLYLIHQVVGCVVVHLTARWIGISSVPLAMAVAFVAAFMIERYPERWIGSALRRNLPKSLSIKSDTPYKQNQWRPEVSSD